MTRIAPKRLLPQRLPGRTAPPARVRSIPTDIAGAFAPRWDAGRLLLLCVGLVFALSALPPVALPPVALAVPGQAVDLVAEPAGRRVTLGVSPDDLRLVPTADGCEILLEGATRGRLGRESLIEMPRLHFCGWVDTDFELRDLQITRARYERVPAERVPDLSRWLAAATRFELDGEPASTLPAAAPGWAPAAPVTWSRGGLMRGQRLVGLIVHPLRYRIVGEALEFELLRELEFELQGATGLPSPDGLPAARAVPWEWKARRGLRAVTIDLRRHPDAVAPPGAPAGGGGDGAIFNPTFRPTQDGSPVEYVIVTTESLTQAFERLAEWKTQKGVQTVVRTVEWISETYPNGVDRAEQIRFFLRDAYLNWGTLWVLLGGDTDLVPVRFALSRLTSPPEYIPADLYYAALDGNWNANANDLFAEAPAGLFLGDDADLVPELYVGRATVGNLTDANAYVVKVASYESNPPVSDDYPGSMLLLGEQLTPILDGAALCEETLTLVPPHMRIVRMYENYQNYPGALPETKATVLDSISAGFGLILHVGHGYHNTMSVGDGTLNNADIDQLVNESRQSVLFAINCSSAAIDFSTIGERFIKNGNGGGVAYIGSARLTPVGAAQEFQNEFFSLVFGDSLTSAGEALALCKLPFVVSAQAADNGHRWMTFAMLLLGDPELPIWHRTPAETFVNHAAGYELGAGGYSVVVNAAGDGVPDARVAIQQAGEALGIGYTDAGGQSVVSFNPHNPGLADLTVTRPGYIPYEASFAVEPTAGPFVHTLELLIDDDDTGASSGNGDGIADAGETIELGMTVRNNGGDQARNAKARISSAQAGTYLTILDNRIDYGNMQAGTIAAGNGPFLIALTHDAPSGFLPVLDVHNEAHGGWHWYESIVLPVYGIELEHYAHALDDPLPGGNGNGAPEAGEVIEYAVTVRNIGNGMASDVSGQLQVLNVQTMLPDPEVTVQVAEVDYGDLAPGVPVTEIPFIFTLSPLAIVEDLRLEFTWSDQYGVREIGLSDLVPPEPVSELSAFGSQSAIRLQWTPPASDDVKGYDVLRSDDPYTGFERINVYTADGSSVYEDASLPPLARFYYQVVVRDSSLNASTPSYIISASTNPPHKTGWPIETGQESAAGVVIDDIDGDGDLELLTGSDAIYAWHHDGTEVRDGDNNPQTSGVFSLDGYNAEFGFHSTPAVADLEGDGPVEIIAVAWREAHVYVWDVDGNARPGWPQPIGGDFNWASPAVDDLDGDGDLEIVVCSGQEGKVFAWHHEGTELADGDGNPATNGVLFSTQTYFLFASPAVGQVAGGPEMEIVVATNDGDGAVYLLDLAGQVMPGWPFEAGNQVTSSPTLIDLDADGFEEVIFAAEDDSVYVMRGDGTYFHGWPQPAEVRVVTGHTASVSIADVDGDGSVDLIYAANDGYMKAWNSDGTLLPGWESVPFAHAALSAQVTQCTPTVADIDGDGMAEVVVGAEDALVYGWNHDGTEADGFPIAIGGEIRGVVALWDLDHDGLMEMALIANDRTVYVWDLPGQMHAERVEWPFFRHDARNTGRYEAPLTSVGVAEPAAGPLAHPHARLLPSAPNPFNPSTTLRFVVPGEPGGARPVRLGIYDVGGRLVRELVRGAIETGEVAIRWDGRSSQGRRVASGTYLIRLEVAGQVLAGKLVMLK